MKLVRVAGTKASPTSISRGQSTGGKFPLLFSQTFTPCLILTLPPAPVPEKFFSLRCIAIDVIADDLTNDVWMLIEFIPDFLSLIAHVPHE